MFRFRKATADLELFRYKSSFSSTYICFDQHDVFRKLKADKNACHVCSDPGSIPNFIYSPKAPPGMTKHRARRSGASLGVFLHPSKSKLGELNSYFFP